MERRTAGMVQSALLCRRDGMAFCRAVNRQCRMRICIHQGFRWNSDLVFAVRSICRFSDRLGHRQAADVLALTEVHLWI
jgi:hypothetical protein